MQVIKQETGHNWALYNGDSCEIMQDLPSDSIGYSVFSPPFSSLYTYSNSDRDMGNCKSDEEFFEHFSFIIEELCRVIIPGRLCSIHCMNLPATITHNGYIGIKDFRGDIIRAFIKKGWIYHSEVCIWKDPVTAMQRTKAIGLLHKQMVKDSAMSRQGIPDYVCTFRKPGTNPIPVSGKLEHFAGDDSYRHDGLELYKKKYADWEKYRDVISKGTKEEIEEWIKNGGRITEPNKEEYLDHASSNLSIDIWQRYASPVWMDINPSNTLQFRQARENDDERHICPLQLDVIERCLQLWTMKGDIVFTPFAGIGSECYQAIIMGRKAIGIELKESYFDVACKNMKIAESEYKNRNRTLFDNME